eukprot:TRINITY_DN56811_c0_g1_i1.p1 TRINITY_DN56811_c0_g1~~TRINITY_DN56811_c0_g1_i1.p1  ORF type:complete len:589 (-),score=74.00 TRINITY_DN56811_c0_g1_i1:167-1933(-)
MAARSVYAGHFMSNANRNRNNSPKKRRRRRRRNLVEASTDQTPELDKSELNILFDQKSHLADELKRLTTRLQTENTSYEEKLEKNKDEKDQLVENYTRDMRDRDKEIKKHKIHVRNLEEKLDRERADLLEQIDKEKEKRLAIKNEMDEQVEALKADVAGLEHFRTIQKSVEQEIEYLKEKLVAMKADHDAELQEQEARHNAEKDKLRNDMVKRLRKTRDELFKLTDDHLHITTQQTIKTNEKLTHEIQLYQKEAKDLLQNNQQLTTDNAALKRSLDLQTSNTEQLIKKSHAQGNTIKTMIAKLKKLEGVVEETKTITEDEKSKKIASLSDTIDQQYDLILDLRNKLDQSNQNKATLEGQVVSLQKQHAATSSVGSETKMFLLQCVDDVKRAIDATNQVKANWTKNTPQPFFGPPSSGAKPLLKQPQPAAAAYHDPSSKSGGQEGEVASTLLGLSMTDRLSVLQFLLDKVQLFEDPTNTQTIKVGPGSQNQPTQQMVQTAMISPHLAGIAYETPQTHLIHQPRPPSFPPAHLAQTAPQHHHLYQPQTQPGGVVQQSLHTPQPPQDTMPSLPSLPTTKSPKAMAPMMKTV